MVIISKFLTIVSKNRSLLTDQWTVITEVPGEIRSPSGTLCGQKLFFVRSIDQHKDLEISVFDFSSNKWNMVSAGNGPAKVYNMFTISGSCILIMDNHCTLYTFDVETGKLQIVGNRNDKEWKWYLTGILK